MRRFATAFSAAMQLIIVLNTGAAFAGFSGSTSNPTPVDVAPPVIEFLAPAEGAALRGFTITDFTWTVSDENPANAGQEQVATVFIGGELFAFEVFPITHGATTWTWSVPNLSSGSNHLVVQVRDAYGNIASRNSENFLILLDNTGVLDEPPAVARLDAPYPNPFNPATRMIFGLPEAGRAAIRVLDLRGRLRRTLFDELRAAGTWEAEWDGRDDAGMEVPAGSYLLRLTVDGRTVTTRKAVLLP